MISYECRCCKETHEGLPDLAFELPQAIFELDEDEREDRCKISSDLYMLDDEHFFVRGVLEIPIIGTSEVFGYGAWSTLSRESFQAYWDTFEDAQQSHLGPFFGYLANPIPDFHESLYLQQDVELRDNGARPRFLLKPADHPLVKVQQEGFSEDRVIAIAESLLHPSSAV